MNMKSWYRTSRLPRPFYFQEKKITFTPPQKKGEDVKHLLGYSQESEQSMEAADLFVTTLTIIFKHIERCKIYLNKTRFLLYLYRVFLF